nr:MAG: hypothetical protein [Cymbidium ringspot virus satellite RNA]
MRPGNRWVFLSKDLFVSLALSTQAGHCKSSWHSHT